MSEKTLSPQAEALELLKTYYSAFNAGDLDAMLACVSEDLVHDVNQGDRRVGKELFRAFGDHMARCYHENLTDIILFANEDGTRGAAEFTVHGTYLSTDEGLPTAEGQRYELPAGAFFDMGDGLITRVSTYYNLAEWTRQVIGE